ncbi:SxtJ family membrane protein [Roseofilum casamattae]|uniref:SxtJ family membrane protein n=1 Tax=Roseofilum casamattae BLCC-M143 TaxID=3022442 RepID=A0ABT7BZW2_9CYAN|nr:SxtJ family membrane protein [Roseofilum casamattae]MDJ1184595.1 SxtJ family membrane protein [Roseofilum casamattae BLCC-M143]
MHPIKKLNKTELRQFGLLFGVMVGLVFGIIWPFILNHNSGMWPWIVLAVFWAWALIAPQTLDGFYHVFARFGLVLGWINTRLILGIIFYVILTPMGLLRKAFGGDPMRREWREPVETYRIPSIPRTAKSLESPF